MKQEQGRHEFPLRPVMRQAAIATVEDVYRRNEWNDDEQRRYQRSFGLEEKTLHEMSNEEIRTILDDFEKARMVIFKETQDEYRSRSR
jgi:Mg2+ and Co2+ transporter CorA